MHPKRLLRPLSEQVLTESLSEVGNIPSTGHTTVEKKTKLCFHGDSTNKCQVDISTIKKNKAKEGEGHFIRSSLEGAL